MLEAPNTREKTKQKKQRPQPGIETSLLDHPLKGRYIRQFPAIPTEPLWNVVESFGVRSLMWQVLEDLTNNDGRGLTLFFLSGSQFFQLSVLDLFSTPSTTA